MEVNLRIIAPNDPTRVRNAQVYLRCILGGKLLETQVFTAESGRGHLGHLESVIYNVTPSMCRTLQFEKSDISNRNVGHTCGLLQGVDGYRYYFPQQSRMHHLNWLDDENLPEFKKKLDALDK